MPRYGTFETEIEESAMTELPTTASGVVRMIQFNRMGAVLLLAAAMTSFAAAFVVRNTGISPLVGSKTTMRIVGGNNGAVQDPLRDDKEHPFRVSLWLVPHPDEEQRLQQVIDHLAAEGNGITFAPHVTVLGGVEIPSLQVFHDDVLPELQAALLSAGSIPCHFHPAPSFGHVWNQAAAMVLEEPDTLEPSAQFTTLVQNCREVLSIIFPEQPAFQSTFSYPLPLGKPHLSLYYGTDKDVPSRELIMKELGGMQPIAFNATRISIWKTDPASSADDVLTWEPLGMVDLQG